MQSEKKGFMNDNQSMKWFKNLTYRSVVLTFPVRSENSFISRERKSSNRRSPCLAAAKISSYFSFLYFYFIFN